MRAWFLFEKRERLKYVSHLDLQRFMHRAFNRTNLPIAFSQGFNPHPVMSFASALAMGWTSEYEIFDIKLAKDVTEEFALKEMSSALPPDLPVTRVRLVEDSHAKLMARLVMADYTVTLPEEAADQIIAQVPAFLEKTSVMAIRKSKSGEKEIDIRPMLMDVKTQENRMYLRTMLTEQDTLKPDLFVKVLADAAGLENVTAKIHRTTLLGKNDAGKIVPLMEI